MSTTARHSIPPAKVESNNADRAALFLGKWQEIWDWMQAHDQRWNPA